MLVFDRFYLNLTPHKLRQEPYKMSKFGEVLFYRTYSRNINGRQEDWADCCIRVINGTISIIKDWYVKCHIPFDENYWQHYGARMAISMYKFEWCPPGRGLWAMGTDYMYERGSMCLYNCGFTVLSDEDKLADDIAWAMDALMLGVGVGASIESWRMGQLKGINAPDAINETFISDDKEGWVESVRLLMQSYLMERVARPRFNYTLIRKRGLPIKGFGGISSGPEPLYKLHQAIAWFFNRYAFDDDYTATQLKADIFNSVARCVVAGNVRRSAEMLMAPIDNHTFRNLKDYSKYPCREIFGHHSNNTCTYYYDGDFNNLGLHAKLNTTLGDPGFANLRNFSKGRLNGKQETRPDLACGLNPCGEITLEDKELCNVAERFMCHGPYAKALEYVTTYCCAVSLLPTHSYESNTVIMRNRRIGIGLCDVARAIKSVGLHTVIAEMRHGYDVVRRTARNFNAAAGVPEPIKVTTIKPGGTVPKLCNATPGCGQPTFPHMNRLFTVAKNHPINEVLYKLPKEECVYDNTAWVYSFPVSYGRDLRPATEVSLWEQAAMLVLMQREWSDNAVSNTLYFDTKKEELEPVLSYIAPSCKSASFLPHTPEGIYEQMPETSISEEEYYNRVLTLPEFNWQDYRSDGDGKQYCDSDKCEIPSKIIV